MAGTAPTGFPEITWRFTLPSDPRLFVRGHAQALRAAWIDVMRLFHKTFIPLHFAHYAQGRYGYGPRRSVINRRWTYQELKDRLGLPYLVSPVEQSTGLMRSTVTVERTITATQKGGKLKLKIPIRGGSGKFRLLPGQRQLTVRQKEVKRRIDEVTAVHPSELRQAEVWLHERYAYHVTRIILNPSRKHLVRKTFR